MANKFVFTERRCWVGRDFPDEAKKCAGPRYTFDNPFANTGPKWAMCQRHARHYHGDEQIDRLISLGLLRKWNNRDAQERIENL